MATKTIKLLQGIDTVIVRVRSLEAATQWYREKLGLTPLFEDAATKLVVLDTGGPTSLTLLQTEVAISPNHHTASYPIFKTPDAAALRQELTDRGIEAGELLQDEYVKYFSFHDQEGNVLEACQVLG
ncbi:MAG: VOC family protein [Chitinophagaceae bacterium]